jgi:hypothetical protein
MARLAIIKRQEKGYIELPPELASNDELELFQLRDGYYLLSVPLGGARRAPERPARDGMVSEQEKAVLRKLLSIRFENRVPAYVGKALNEQEKSVLRELERKGLVNVFKGRKYVEGVYNINDSIYPLLAQKGEARRPDEAPAARQERPPESQPPASQIGLLDTRGFIIIADKREAMMLSEQLNGRMKSGAVVGVKGFDNKFYAVTRDYFTSSEAKIARVLKEEMDAPSIAEAAKLDREGCIAVLRLMAENGEIIEKKKGVFAPV